MDTGAAGGRFRDVVAIVTGSSRASIGRSTPPAAWREGAPVVINGRSESRSAPRARELRDEGLEVAGVAGSLQDDATAARLVDAAIDRYGRLDFVVNTVGGTWYQGSPRDIDKAGTWKTVELNTWGSAAAGPGGAAGRPGGRGRCES